MSWILSKDYTRSWEDAWAYMQSLHGILGLSGLDWFADGLAKIVPLI